MTNLSKGVSTMESVTKSKTPLVLSNSDCAKILQYFENSTAEKVLLLRTKGEKCEPDKIDGVFNLCGNFAELANEEHILFSVAQIMKCMDVCMQTQSGFIMIHNHKRGNVFSKSDMQTEVQLLHEIIKRQLPSFHFMVLGMDSQTLRIHSYTKQEGDYQVVAWKSHISV